MNRASFRNPRRGIAAIEFLMTLPTLTVLFVMLLTIAIGGVLCIDLSHRARSEAWSDRDAPAAPAELAVDALAPQLPRVFASGEKARSAVSPGEGVLSGAAQERLSTGSIPLLSDNLPEASRRHAALAGAWDHRVLPFLDRNGSGDRLRIDSRIRAFAPGFDVRAFKELVPGG